MSLLFVALGLVLVLVAGSPFWCMVWVVHEDKRERRRMENG